jgi:hypothetical protein
VIRWILFVLPAAFERFDPRVPFVVTSKAVPRARSAESRITPNEIGLREYDLHRSSGLLALDPSDEGPKHVEREKYLLDREDAPAAVRLTRRLCLPEPRDGAQSIAF